MAEQTSSEMKNLLLAAVLSLGCIILFNMFFPEATTKNVPENAAAETSGTTQQTPMKADVPAPVPSKAETSAAVLKADARIVIDTPDLQGSIRLQGAKLDDLLLKKYRETMDENSPYVRLLAPTGTAHAYYAEFGWVSTDPSLEVPTLSTPWTVKSKAKNFKLTAESPLVLTWKNRDGLVFTRTITLDDKYMFTVKDTVSNEGGKAVLLQPYALMGRTGLPDQKNKGAAHEGYYGFFGRSLKEVTYQDMYEKKEKYKETSYSTQSGWAGMTDKYWMTVFAFDKGKEDIAVRFVRNDKSGDEPYLQVDAMKAPVELVPGQMIENTSRLYAGAKEVETIDAYEKNLNIDRFDLTVDFGWYYFLTKPFFYILTFLFHKIGNMGLAILVFATCLRLLMLPIVNKSYSSMAKMKKIQPQVNELHEKYNQDKVRLNQELMALYKREKINPAAGCLPMLIQIPVFFSLYKVIYISIELRHAPFFGWITDLSAKDPSSVFTLFGYLNWPIPDAINLGVWPLLMGLTMVLQQALSPKPADKTQAMIMTLMPIFFTFLLSNFASGLVIYWTWSNVFSIIQQRFINRRNAA